MSVSDTLETVTRFETELGGQIYRLPLEVFPGFSAFAYLVLVDDLRVLVDTGSGFGRSNEDLEAGLMTAGELSGQPLHFSDLTHVLISHGHIDHFGGLAFIQAHSQAQVGVHELDLRTLTRYEERLVVISRRLNRFLIEAGVSERMREHLLEMYNFTKSLYHSVPIDFTYQAAGMKVGPFHMLHVPGHCAGHVVIRLHDVLFSGDHVLDGISPHQAPESLTLSTGLDHYLRSLEDLRLWAPDVRLTLGGHNAPVRELDQRIEAIKTLHRRRLDQVLDLLGEPQTISQISQALFGEVSGYHVLLALEEAGAHVEYLNQRGLVSIENLSDLENDPGPVPIRYQRAGDQNPAIGRHPFS